MRDPVRVDQVAFGSTSRYLLSCEALEGTKQRYASSVFEHVFQKFGLPKAIRTDNGAPFASVTAFFGLSKLSVWWLLLGIDLERIKPAHPQKNGRNERMHLTLKKEATKPPGKNSLQQQAKFDHWQHEYNHEQPHQAIGMHYPAASPSRSAGGCASAHARSFSAGYSPARMTASGRSPITSG